MICQEGKPEATVDRTLDTKVFKGWVETDNPWTSDDETDNGTLFTLIFVHRSSLNSSLCIPENLMINKKLSLFQLR